MVASFAAFADELEKISGLLDKQRVAYHFSKRSEKDRWDKFHRRVKGKGFLKALVGHPEADEKLIRHAKAIHALHNGKPLAKVPSSTGAGKTYEIRRLANGEDKDFQKSRLGCTCNDWRYHRSVQLDPGRDCKHIKTFRRGAVE